MIARLWRGSVALSDSSAYATYLLGTDNRITDYTDVPGNMGAWVLRRETADRAEFVMFSLWSSLDSLKTYAGDAPEKAVFYEKDNLYLTERDEVVSHFDVLGHSVPDSPAPTTQQGLGVGE